MLNVKCSQTLVFLISWWNILITAQPEGLVTGTRVVEHVHFLVSVIIGHTPLPLCAEPKSIGKNFMQTSPAVKRKGKTDNKDSM